MEFKDTEATSGGAGGIYVYQGSSLTMDTVSVNNSIAGDNGGFLYFVDGNNLTINNFECDT